MTELEWLAHYDEGALPQFDNSGNENKYPSINRYKINKFSLCKHIGNKYINVASIDIKPKEQWWYRRVTALRVNPITGEQKGKTYFHVIGQENRPNIVINSDGNLESNPMVSSYFPILKYHEEV